MTVGARRAEWLAVPILALALSAGLVFVPPPAYLADQRAYTLLVVKTLEPDLFGRDPLYRHAPSQLHVPLFIDAQAALARRLGGDAERALVWLAWPIGALFLAGHYALFRAVTGSPLAAGLTALAALTIRNSLGGEFWGFEGVRSANSRTVLAGLTPLLLLLFLRWRRRASFPAYYLVLGLAANLHPPSAYLLAEATALAHLWLERLSRRALLQVGAGVALFAAGAAAYVVPFLAGRDDVTGAASLALARRAMAYRFDYLFYPLDPASLLSVAFHLALPLAAWLWWRRRSPPGASMAGLDAVAGAAVVAAFGGLALVQAAGVLLDRPYADVQQLRALRLVYPVLLSGLALVYAALLARRTWRARVVVAALLLASLVPPGALIHAVSAERRDAVKALLGVRVPPPAPPAPAGALDAQDAMYAWVRRATPRSALFLSDDFDFRRRTHRSITGTFKDGALVFLAGSRPFVDWHRLDGERLQCRAARGRGCWFPLARRLGADYVVVDPALAEAEAPPDFERVWERGGLSVWRRL